MAADQENYPLPPLGDGNKTGPISKTDSSGDIYVGITHESLNIEAAVQRVKRSNAGAVVMFAGTTRDNFNGQTVKHLQYGAYTPMALRTMNTIATQIKAKYDITAICLMHRLGVVPVCENSILILVSAPHRQEAWRAGEEALERCKDDVEIWKLEVLDGSEPVWKSNRGEPITTETPNLSNSIYDSGPPQ